MVGLIGYEYSVRESARAKNVRLRLSPLEGLVVVVPRGYDRRRLPALVERHRPWIERTRARLNARIAEAGNETDPALVSSGPPGVIELRAAGERWQVIYLPRQGAAGVRLTSDEGNRQLLLSGKTADQALCRQVLMRWMSRSARDLLGRRLDYLAGKLGVRYGDLQIRAQRTRWGSCSRRGTISLNLKLLFMPPELVDYVLLHELCHLAHPNHSPRFWTALGRHVPDCAACRRALREEGRRSVPGWANS